MGLSSDLLSQFAKATKDTTKTKKESTVYGTAVESDGVMYAKLDGSDRLTPISTTADVKAGERVTILIKDHKATITGNISSPAARTVDVQEASDKILKVNTLMSHEVTTDELDAITATIDALKAKTATLQNMSAVRAYIESLEAKLVKVNSLSATDVDIVNAEIENLEAEVAKIADLDVEDLSAINAEIEKLRGYTAEFTYVSADVLAAVKGDIETLNADKLSAGSADLKYVMIDRANIDQAWIEKLFAESGIIKSVTSEDLTVTKELVGVVISGDLIKANTIKADSLIVKDSSDGLYYKLNFEGGVFTDGEHVPDDKLHGSVIAAQSITADKISVSDLIAFAARIGGFHLTGASEETPGAIYSELKDSVKNENRGVYLDTDGQIAFGDSNNYIRFYKDENGVYKLDIQADSLRFGAESKDNLKSLGEQIKMDNYEDPETGEIEPCLELSEADSDRKQIITSSQTIYKKGDNIGTKIGADGIVTEEVSVKGDFRQGNWVWATRNGGKNYGLMWKEVTS